MNMPKTDAPTMEQIKFSVPAPMLEQALALAERDGLKPAEFHRTIWMLGLSAYSEQANKRMVAQGLLRKQRAINDAE
jgi:hypothetical protein